MITRFLVNMKAPSTSEIWMRGNNAYGKLSGMTAIKTKTVVVDDVEDDDNDKELHVDQDNSVVDDNQCDDYVDEGNMGDNDDDDHDTRRIGLLGAGRNVP